MKFTQLLQNQQSNQCTDWFSLRFALRLRMYLSEHAVAQSYAQLFIIIGQSSRDTDINNVYVYCNVIHLETLHIY